MDGANFSVTSLLIVSLLALLVPLLVSRLRGLRVPIVVGEILIGIVVGKSGFDIIHQSQWLSFLQFFGLSYLMFVSGLEIDFGALRLRRVAGQSSMKAWLQSAPVFATFACAVTFGLAYLLSTGLYHQQMVKSPLLFALIITTTSLTVVVPVLKEYNLLSSEFGQLILAAAVFADFVTMSLISVAVSLFKGGFSPRVFLVFILLVVLLVFYRVARRFARFNLLSGLADGTAQLGIRASLALMIVFMVLSQTLGVQVILGTFLAGVLVGLVNDKERSDIRNKLDAIGFGFLIPIFFIMVGVNFNVRSLFSDPKALLLLPILFVATYLFKALPALLLRLRYPWRETLSGASLLTTQMSVTVAAASVGLQIGAIRQGVDTAIILVAMLTSVISPVLFGRLFRPQVDNDVRSCAVVGNMPGASLLVEHIRAHGDGCAWIMDYPEENVDWSSVRAMAAYGEDDAKNIAIASAAAAAGVRPALCLIRDLATFHQYQNTENLVPINPQLATVTLIDQLLHYPISTQLLQAPANLQIREIELTNRAFHRVTLMNINLPGNLLILSVVRDGVQVVAHGNTELLVGDTLIVVGSPEDISDFAQIA